MTRIYLASWRILKVYFVAFFGLFNEVCIFRCPRCNFPLAKVKDCDNCGQRIKWVKNKKEMKKSVKSI